MGKKGEKKHPLFPVVEKNLQEIAKKRKVSIVVVIEEFKKDIQNLGNSDYQKNIEQINIKSISDEVKSGLISYLNDVARRYIDIEAQVEKRERQRKNLEKTKQENNEKWIIVQNSMNEILQQQEGISKLEAIRIIMEEIQTGICSIELTRKEKRFILRKLEELEDEELSKQGELQPEEKEEIQLEKDDSNPEGKQNNKEQANEIWEQICGKVRIESMRREKPEVVYWIAVRDSLFSEHEGKMQRYSSASDEIKEIVRQLLDDEIYYQDVKNYTHDFSFLRDFPEVALGSTPRRGFYDIKSLLKYTDLRTELQTTWDEYAKIDKLLDTETDEATIRVLQARKVAIERQREKRKKEGR